jgi:hypothetical protein
MSLKDIASVIRQIHGSNNDDANSDYCNNKSKDTKASYLLSIGKMPLDVMIGLDLPASQVYKIQQKYWSLKELHDPMFVYSEIKF